MEKRSTPSLQITDRFGAQAAFASLRLPDGTEATVPAEHAAAIYVNEQPAFWVFVVVFTGLLAAEVAIMCREIAKGTKRDILASDEHKA